MEKIYVNIITRKRRAKLMFYFGEYNLSLDDKFRMRIPNKLKSMLEGEYAICAGTDNCLFLMTLKQFNDMFVEVAEDTPFSKTAKQEALRKLSSTILIPEEDAQGRFVLPSKLKAYAGIKKKLIFLGAMNRIEIWSEERYNEKYALDKLDINEVVKELNI